MKKLFSLLLLSAMLLVSSHAMAQSWGPDFAKFTVTPAAGWTSSPVENGVQLTNNKSVLIIQVVKSSGATPEAFAKAVVAKAGISDPKYTTDSDSCKMVGKKDGTEMTMIFVSAEDNIVIFTTSGPDTDAMGEMMGSLKDAK
ncbi:MAG: hypothetical protein IKN64_04235 [Desulfovibrio sp.]|nr:hypothetical protein [Desulfovibrio sp.]